LAWFLQTQPGDCVQHQNSLMNQLSLRSSTWSTASLQSSPWLLILETSTFNEQKIPPRLSVMKTICLTFVGTALSLAVSSSVAVAQPSNAPTQIQLSPEGQRILCQQFPLNSRCSGSPRGQGGPGNPPPSGQGGPGNPPPPGQGGPGNPPPPGPGGPGNPPPGP